MAGRALAARRYASGHIIVLQFRRAQAEAQLAAGDVAAALAEPEQPLSSAIRAQARELLAAALERRREWGEKRGVWRHPFARHTCTDEDVGASRPCCLRAALRSRPAKSACWTDAGQLALAAFCRGENKKGAQFALLFCVACQAATFN